MHYKVSKHFKIYYTLRVTQIKISKILKAHEASCNFYLHFIFNTNRRIYIFRIDCKIIQTSIIYYIDNYINNTFTIN